MRPTQNDHWNALEACWNFSDFKPEFDDRGSYLIDSEDGKLAAALNCLSYCAGMYTCGESVHYSRAEFEAAMRLVKTATRGHVRAIPQAPERSYTS